MQKFKCKNAACFSGGNFYECASCGNHVCEKQAELCGFICPHCFGNLNALS